MKHLLVLLLCYPLAAFSQLEGKRDSLLKLAAGAGSDTARIWAMMETGKMFLQKQADTALVYLDKALELAESKRFERGIVKCRINRSYAYNNLGRYAESVADCQVAIPLCEKLGMKKEKVAALNNMGNAWDFLGNRWMAIDAFSRALPAMEGVNLPPGFPLAVRNNLARQYNDLRLYEKAFGYGQKSLEEATALGDSNEVAAALNTMTYSAICLGRDKEALGYCRRIERISRGNDPLMLAFALHNMAALLIDEQPQQAEKMAMEALEVARQSGDLFSEQGTLYLLARFSIYKKAYEKARHYAEQSMEKARKAHLTDEVAKLNLLLSDIALAEGNTEAYRTLRQQYQNMNDTLAGNSLVHATQELETKYETEKKVQQIAALEHDRALQALKIREKNNMIAGLVLFAVLLFTAGFLLVRNLRHRRRLSEQENQIQLQQITQLKQEQQLNVADAIMRSQEDERSRLARDLHDGLGGMLSGVKQSLNGMKGNQILTETAATALGQVIGDLDRSIGELRHIARNMMPEALVRFGLRDALQDYCDHLRLTGGLAVHYQAFGLEKRLPQQTEVVLFRIAQELLNNIVKHAGASRVLVQLMENDGRVSLTVEDDGKGFDMEKLKTAPGVGWLNVKSRVEYLNGRLDIRSEIGKGTSVNIEFDYRQIGNK